MYSILLYPTLLLTVTVLIKYWHNIKTVFKRLHTAYTFFDQKYIVDNFKSIESLGWPFKTATHGKVANFKCINTNTKSLPVSFVFRNQEYNVESWLNSHTTTGLVVLKILSPTDAHLMYESYNTNNKVISWSLNKSFVSALIGIAIQEGKISSVNDYVTTYVPTLNNSGYNNVTIKNILQMSSGVHFDETYDNQFSDINAMMYSIVLGYNIDDYICKLKSVNEPGTQHNYISADTQVLGMVLKSVIGEQSITSYFEEKIWKIAGFESNCDWLIDNTTNQMELTFGTLNACTRDYARFGWLYLNKGLSPLDGNRIVDEAWVNDSITCEESHLLPEYEQKLGYGYQWWIPYNKNDKTRGDYLAIGVYGQFIYIDPKNNIVIAKNSADYKYNTYVDHHGINVSELEAVALFRTISDHYQ